MLFDIVHCFSLSASRFIHIIVYYIISYSKLILFKNFWFIWLSRLNNWMNSQMHIGRFSLKIHSCFSHNCLKFNCSVRLDMSEKCIKSQIQALKSWQTANSCNRETNQLILSKQCSGNLQHIFWYKLVWGAGIRSVKIKIPPFLSEELCV